MCNINGPLQDYVCTLNEGAEMSLKFRRKFGANLGINSAEGPLFMISQRIGKN